MPRALEERLGPEATLGLVQYFSDARKEWTAEVIGLVGDRFDRRLVEETSKLRVDMTHGFAAVRQEMAQEFAAVRQEMAQGFAALRTDMATNAAALRQAMAATTAALRQEIAGTTAALRQEIAGNAGALRQEMADQRFEILKWAFLFWIGQFFAVAGLMTILIRLLRT